MVRDPEVVYKRWKIGQGARAFHNLKKGTEGVCINESPDDVSTQERKQQSELKASTLVGAQYP
jgi:hypothetical protein